MVIRRTQCLDSINNLCSYFSFIITQSCKYLDKDIHVTTLVTIYHLWFCNIFSCIKAASFICRLPIFQYTYNLFKTFCRVSQTAASQTQYIVSWRPPWKRWSLFHVKLSRLYIDKLTWSSPSWSSSCPTWPSPSSRACPASSCCSLPPTPKRH